MISITVNTVVVPRQFLCGSESDLFGQVHFLGSLNIQQIEEYTFGGQESTIDAYNAVRQFTFFHLSILHTSNRQYKI